MKLYNQITECSRKPVFSRARKISIYANLYNRLNREPTHKELVEEVKRILNDALIERNSK